MNARQKAIEEIRSRPPVSPIPIRDRLSTSFGEQVFHLSLMKEYLDPESIETLTSLIASRNILTQELAVPLAKAVRSWAIDKGATHYVHWLQALTGQVAEKHNTFLDIEDGKPIDAFSSEQLRQGQPDESSFPSDGDRSTFEARGAMVWDCQSPIFIFETTYGKTLVIPTLFLSHSGDILDYKRPLLNSVQVLEKSSLAICEWFDTDIQHINPRLGLEHEYFLVDKSLYDLRPDLIFSGRSLIGASFSHRKTTTSQYFSAIPARVYAFMNELEYMAHRLGIPLKTRHNEVAPAQFESASLHEPVILAIDHGLMVMDLIQRVARKHSFVALLQEKPFDGLIGSSKHNNWSLETNTGKNLLSPGGTGEDNLLFLIFFVSMIKALYTQAPLLGAMLASAGNDLRLGSDQAPPPIISLFIGTHLTKILQDIVQPPRRKKNENVSDLRHLGIEEIPQVLVDNTDRNRTSPIAFTGNKFEFRLVGSSSNCSGLMILLNHALADQLSEFKHRVKAKMNRGRKQESAIIDIIREYIIDSRAICFEGDSLEASWRTEAEKRGLFNIPSTPEALHHISSPEANSLFSSFFPESSTELRRYQTSRVQAYIDQIKIEADLIIEMGRTMVFPMALSYLQSIQSLSSNDSSSLPPPPAAMLYHDINQFLNELFGQLEQIQQGMNQLDKEEDLFLRAEGYAENMRPLFAKVKANTAKLEGLIPDSMWSLPKVRELLHTY